MFPRMQLKHRPTHVLPHAVVRIGLEDDLYVTAWEPTTEPSEAAPARALRSAVICFASSSRFAHGSRTPTPEGSQPACAVGVTPIRSTTDRHLLSPSSFTRSPVGSPYGSLSHAGRLRAYQVPPRYRCGLGRISSPVVHHLRRVSSEHPDLTTRRLAQACQQLALVLYDDV
jgi:hypothetical protein